MRAHLTNAAFGALDYIAYPAGMLLLAPQILRALGMSRFGVWAMASAILMTGAVLASGFGNANVRWVAQARGTLRNRELVETVRCALGIHLVLGLVIGGVAWCATPALAHFAVKAHIELTLDCLWSFRITAVLILIRAIETVCSSTQRAFGRYGSAIYASVTARVLSLILACAMPAYGGVTAIMTATLIVSLIALWIQIYQLKRLLGIRRLSPSFQGGSARRLLEFGIFTWIQAVAGLLFGQVDRLLAGLAFGVSSVAVYTLCVQMTQPIYGITASGLNFLFPLLAANSERDSLRALRRKILRALAANLAIVAAALAILIPFGSQILRMWVGPDVAQAAGQVLPAAAWGSALSALTVTGSYSLLALGRPRLVAGLSILGGLVMAGTLTLLIPRYGLAGIAYGRLFPGFVGLFVYIPLARLMMAPVGHAHSANRLPICEEV